MILDINQLFMLKSMLRKDRMLTAGILKIYVLWLIHSICFGFFISFSRFSSLIMQICFDQLSRVESGQVPALFTCNIDLQKLCYPVTWSNPVFLTNIILNIKNFIMSNICTAIWSGFPHENSNAICAIETKKYRSFSHWYMQRPL